MAEKTLPEFTRAADAALNRVRQTYADRGYQYGDTWALGNIESRFTELALTEFGHGLGWDAEQLRILQAAVLVDIKDSRLLGGWVSDHGIDGIAYRAIFQTLMDEWGRQ